MRGHLRSFPRVAGPREHLTRVHTVEHEHDLDVRERIEAECRVKAPTTSGSSSMREVSAPQSSSSAPSARRYRPDRLASRCRPSLPFRWTSRGSEPCGPEAFHHAGRRSTAPRRERTEVGQFAQGGRSADRCIPTPTRDPDGHGATIEGGAMLLAQINPDQATTIVEVLGAVASARGTQVPTHVDRAVIEAAAPPRSPHGRRGWGPACRARRRPLRAPRRWSRPGPG